MKKLICLIMAAMLALSAVSAFATEYTDKETIRQVQQALNDMGYNCGKPDGSAGKNTKKAIADYQASKGMEATGTIDDALLISLGLMEGEAVELDYIIGENDSDYALTVESSDLPFAQLKWGASPAEVVEAIGATGDVTGAFTAKLAIKGLESPLPIRFGFSGGGLDSVTITAKEGLRVVGKFRETDEGAKLYDFVDAFYKPADFNVRLPFSLDDRIAIKSPYSDGYVGYINRDEGYDMGVIFSKPVHFDEMPFRESKNFYITTSSLGEVIYFCDNNNRSKGFDTEYSLDKNLNRTTNGFADRIMLTGSHYNVENSFPHFDLYYVYGGTVNPQYIKSFLFTVDNVMYQFTPSPAGDARVTLYRDYTQQFFIDIGEHNNAFMGALAATKKKVICEIYGDNGFHLRFDVPDQTIKMWNEDWAFFKQAGGAAPIYLRACNENPVTIR